MLRWALLSYSALTTEAGVTLTITTNHPCHLYVLWTSRNPWIHVKLKDLRGTPIGTKTRYCCVATNQVFQLEAGDTTNHTFDIVPWPSKQQRWFRFHGTVGVQDSPSDSPCLTYTRGVPPLTKTFYPDKHPESTSCDGFAQRTLGAAGEPWSLISSGAGTSASASTTTAAAGIIETGPAYPDKFVSIARVAMLFDISVIPPNAAIISASLKLYGHLKYNWKNQSTHVNIYHSFPNSNTDIVVADYNHFSSTPFSTPINYTAFKTFDWNTFNANAALLQYIASVLSGDKIVKLAMREADYDAPNSPPAWVADGGFGYYITMSDYDLTTRPSLTITYQEL